MRLAILPVLLPMLLAAGAASAEFSLFGTPSRVPANPFASNYASAPAHASERRARRVRRPAVERPGPLRPPGDIPR